MAGKGNAIDALMEQSVLASPPDLLFKIINSLDSELNSRQIGEIIGHDQSISAQVLKLSNSSFFGFKGSIKTLDRAINILGTKTVRNIAVTTLLFAHTNRIRLWNLDILNFWLHAFLVADITRELSQKVGLDGDESYIAGLLHDIGKLILYSQRQEKEELFSKEHSSEDIDNYERETWGIDSTELGRKLLEKWNIPDEIVEAIAEHKTPKGKSLLSKVIFLANEFACISTDFHFKSRLSYPVFQKLLNDMKLSDSGLTAVCKDIPTIVERGKLIMKVMSKSQTANFSIRRRATTSATLVANSEFGLSRCLLELMGFKVDVVTPQILKERDEALKKLEEEKARKEAEKDAEEAKPKEQPKGASFLQKLFRKGSEPAKKDEEEQEEAKAESGPISWQPLVIFDQVEPFKILRPGVTVYQILRNPADMKETPLPFFFSNPDIKVK